MAISLTAIVNKYKESHPEVHEWVEFTVGEGAKAKTFRYHHPIYQSNEESRRIARVQKSDDATNSDLVRAFLGDRQYDEFVKAGGVDTAVIMLMQLVQENDLPEMSVRDSEGK
ncbi:hypothetical protein [Bifidobacterium aquikefiri]|uniref:hypothetical protein n=1 Tax=Bifidobacterium aquikefiri TaxID=1653207 RepID=UPI0039E9EFB7